MAEDLDLTLRQRVDWLAHMGKAILQQHHQDDAKYLRNHIAHDSVVFDVGAHAGQYTKLFAKLANDGTVYAFEPGAYALSILTKAVGVLRLRNVEIVRLALSDAEGEISLHMPVKPKGTLGFGLAHVGVNREHLKTKSVSVPMTTVDSFVAARKLSRLDFIKADIEGWELHMLRGATKTLARFRPALQLEVADKFLRRAGDSAAALDAFMVQHGYKGSLLANGDWLFLAS